eukprot:6907344-Karenia_brevis.AAC.1
MAWQRFFCTAIVGRSKFVCGTPCAVHWARHFVLATIGLGRYVYFLSLVHKGALERKVTPMPSFGTWPSLALGAGNLGSENGHITAIYGPPGAQT